MVGDMKFLEPEGRAGAALGVVLAAASFSFSPKDLRRGEAWQPQTPPPPLETEEALLCGQSAGLKGLESALLLMAQHGLAWPGDGDLAAAVAIS